jgi:DNA adenine methylase
MLSNSDTEFIRDLYDGYPQVEVQATRLISSKVDERGIISELLMTNRYERRGG